MNTKITPDHLRRVAVVYTLGQIRLSLRHISLVNYGDKTWG